MVARLVRLYPLFTGVGTIANSGFVRLLSGRSDAVGWGKVAGGFEVAAPLDDYVGRAIYFAGELDPKVTWACRQIVRRGDVVLDIGANLGLVTFSLSAMVGEHGVVHAFEPIPRMHQFIASAVQRNGVGNVHIHPHALGANTGTLDLSIPVDHAGRASFIDARAMPGATTLAVRTRTLTDVIEEQGIGHIRLVKMDVEGFEPEVIEGATRAFRQDPPDAVLFELNGEEALMSDSRTVTQLADLGYRFYALPKQYFSMRALSVNANDSVPGNAHDFLALHPSANDARLRARLGT